MAKEDTIFTARSFYFANTLALWGLFGLNQNQLTNPVQAAQAGSSG